MALARQRSSIRPTVAVLVFIAACGGGAGEDGIVGAADRVASSTTTSSMDVWTNATSTSVPMISSPRDVPKTDASIADSPDTTTAPSVQVETIGDGTSLEALVVEAFASMVSEPASTIEGTIEASGLPDVSRSVEMTFSMSSDPVSGDSAVSMDLGNLAETDDSVPSMAGLLGEIAFVQVGETVYVKFPFLTSLMGVETPWISMPSDEDFITAQDAAPMTPSDPTAIFDAFESGDADVEDHGVDVVGGVEWRHAVLLVDVERLTADQDEASQIEDTLGAATGIVPMDVWIDDHRRVVQIRVEVDGEQTPDDGFGTAIMTMRFSDHGKSAVITPPPSGDVTSIDDIEGLDFTF